MSFVTAVCYSYRDSPYKRGWDVRITECPRLGLVRDLVETLSLGPHEHKLASTLSGGNKRKLSVGIALIGAPRRGPSVIHCYYVLLL